MRKKKRKRDEQMLPIKRKERRQEDINQESKREGQRGDWT